MNKALLFASLAAVFAVTAVPQAFAADATVRFVGDVKASSCEINGGGGATGSAGNLTVTLPTVGTDSLAAAGDVAGDVAFQIVVGGAGQTDCTGGATGRIGLHFIESDPAIVSAGNGNLANLSGTASNVQIQLVNLDTGGTALDLVNGPSPGMTVNDNQVVFNLAARYVAVGGAAEEGTVDTQVSLEAVYY